MSKAPALDHSDTVVFNPEAPEVLLGGRLKYLQAKLRSADNVFNRLNGKAEAARAQRDAIANLVTRYEHVVHLNEQILGTADGKDTGR